MSSLARPPSPALPLRKTQLDALAMCLLVLCCLFWGFQQVLAKATLPEVPPIFQVSLRFVGATLLLMLWCAWRGIALFERDGSLPGGLLAGSLFALEFTCIYLGLQYTSASLLTLLLYTSPFWVALILPLFVQVEKLKRLQWVGLLCAFAGVLLALRAGLGSTGGRLGMLLALAAGASWGLTTVVIRASKLSACAAEKTLFYQIALSALILPFVSLLLGERWSLQLSSFAWGSLALQAVVGAFASYLVWMWMLTRYPAAKMSAFVFLTPVFALGFSSLWLGERITAPLLAALACVAVGIVLVNKK
jgi:drug/metabolite transporter (DMT)-like permease